ncbi:MAG: 50S ribosomal protein L29 [Candidatus Electryonea clarkiae]|nr:50S ribosomal protein L29 [Candidatus Electryonea clarkiae]MDP8288619.1 50S ribosomal protein L29 [Candidatus Electryonea clarkiae]
MRDMEELRGLELEELKGRLADSEEELANLRFQHGSHQLENTIKIRSARRHVARLKTLLHEKLSITVKAEEQQ